MGNNQKTLTGIIREKDKDKDKDNHRISTGKSRYNRILSYLSHVNCDDYSIFKKKIMRKNEYLKCDICMERLKIDDLTMYSPLYNVGGHLNHIIEYANSIQIYKEQFGRNKN